MSSGFQPEVGKLIRSEAHRDAIHIAVAPVVAAETLMPGSVVSLYGPDSGENTQVWIGNKDKIGVVDPFLTKPVQRGERFYVFLYPNTITSLRHHWTHPAFTQPDAKHLSEQWLRHFAADNDTDYDYLIEGLKDGEVCFGNDDGPTNARNNLRELLHHASIVTGRMIAPDFEPTFRCAC